MIEYLKKYFHKPELINTSLMMSGKNEDVLNFLNAHILKASISRIIGLIRLFNNKSVKDDERKLIIIKLEAEAKDLELSVKEIKLFISTSMKFDMNHNIQ